MSIIEHNAAEIADLREQITAMNRWWNFREIGLHLALRKETKRADALADQLEGAVSDLAEANARIETLLAAENEAWRDAQAWKERAVELGWGQSGALPLPSSDQPNTETTNG